MLELLVSVDLLPHLGEVSGWGFFLLLGRESYVELSERRAANDPGTDNPLSQCPEEAAGRFKNGWEQSGELLVSLERDFVNG